MPFLKFVATQLRRPSGLIGRFVVSRALNRGNVQMNQLTLTALELEPGDHVIEVGFGGGDLIKRMSAVVGRGCIAGVDFSPDMVDICSKRFAALIQSGRLELLCADADNLPYGSEHFSKACTVNTIYFWPDPIGPFKELHRVLRGGGRAVICFNPRQTLQRVPFTKYGFSFYDPEQVRQLLETTGFRQIEMVPGSSRLGEFVCAVATK